MSLSAGTQLISRRGSLRSLGRMLRSGLARWQERSLALPDFSVRASTPEIIDSQNVPAPQLEHAMGQLVTINRLLLGYTPSIAGIKKLLPKDTREFTLLDVGCGSGDTLREIAKWARRRGIRARLHGIELSPVLAQRAARLCSDYPEIAVQHSDLFALKPGEQYDIVHCALMLHHFPDDALVARAIAKMREAARLGIVVNDLHRHWFAYASISALTRAFSDSHIIQNDGPLSVARAFTRDELLRIAGRAGLGEVAIQWRWAFRWLMTAGVK